VATAAGTDHKNAGVRLSLCLSVIGPAVAILNKFDETVHSRLGPEK